MSTALDLPHGHTPRPRQPPEPDRDVAPVREGLAHLRPAPWAVQLGYRTDDPDGTPARAHALIRQAVPELYRGQVDPALLWPGHGLPGTATLTPALPYLHLPTITVPLLIVVDGPFLADEFARALRPGGQLLWCTTRRDSSPTYLPPHSLHRLLGTRWHARSSQSGDGEWAVFTAPWGRS